MSDRAFPWMALVLGALGFVWSLAAHAQDWPATVVVPEGPFIAGSNRAERELAYRLDETAYGHHRTRDDQWYENEVPRHQATTKAFAITRTLITNRQYAAFIAATGHDAPTMTAELWTSYHLNHGYDETQKFQWVDGKPPKGRDDHPVVLVSQADALAYAAWLSEQTGAVWRLPDELEWEKAARGIDGRMFPWGATFNAKILNSADQGPYDTLPVGQFPQGVSPFGLLDAVGQVYQWTSSLAKSGKIITKGGAWDDKGCGICRPAGRDERKSDLKHILIGFRLVRQDRPDPKP